MSCVALLPQGHRVFLSRILAMSQANEVGDYRVIESGGI